jgi:hypothetical protein
MKREELLYFCNEYIRALNTMYPTMRSYSIEAPAPKEKRFLFTKKKVVRDYDLSLELVDHGLIKVLKDIYRDMDLMNNNNRWKFLCHDVKEFASFMLKDAPYYLYDNDSPDIKASFDDIDSVKLKIEVANMHVIFQFTDTSINVPKVGFNDPTNPLSFMVDNEHLLDEPSTVSFTNISVYNTNSEKIAEYKTTNCDPIPLDEKTNILLTAVTDSCKKVIFDTLNDIIDNYVYHMTKLYLSGESIKIKELVENDGVLKVWRQ